MEEAGRWGGWDWTGARRPPSQQFNEWLTKAAQDGVKAAGPRPEPVHEWLKDGETRITNPKTGGEKGSKPAQLGAVDPASLLELASVAGASIGKYERYNFSRGCDWSLFFDAMMRHSLAFWAGEDNDPESGLPHMAHAAWHACALLTMMRRHPDLDDRFPR